MKQVETCSTGRFIRYDEILGRGSYKVVYKAFDTHEAMDVAWNKLQVERIPEEQLQKVEFEVDLLKRIDHKNIINLFAAWRSQTSKGKPTMDFITELMSSGTLKEYLKRSRVMKLKVIRRWCHNLLEAIAYLHDQKPPVMHRDLKCDNIFINGNVGEVKIGDLGLSGVKQDAVAQSVIGTPEFMAPELYEEAYTEKVDIYAFGMCMLEMLTMEYPYCECENPAQIFRKVFSGERPLSFQRLPQSEIKQVIGACLEREKRRPTAQQLLTHPFFFDWASDDGTATNLSVVSHQLRPNVMPPSESSPSKKKSTLGRGDKIKPKGIQSESTRRQTFGDLRVGQSMVFNSEMMKREVLVGKEQLEETFCNPAVVVTSANAGMDLRVAMKIPVDGEVKKVEFFFDPSAEDVEQIVAELVTEFQLRDTDIQDLKSNIKQQVHEQLQRRTYKSGNRLEANSRMQQYPGNPKKQNKGTVYSETEGTLPRSRSGNGNPNLGGGRNAGIKSEKVDHERTTESSSRRESGGDIYVSQDCNDTQSSRNSHGSKDGLFDRAAFKANMALMDHCANGRYGIITQKLRNGARVDFADYDRRTPLHLAATEGHHDVVELLIKNGADINAEDRWGSTPFDDAKKNGHEKVADLLVNAGARVETRDLPKSEINSMELMQYAANGFIDMVREKLMAGAEASFADYDKRTPLHLACAEGHPDIVELLLLNGGDPMFKDRFGATPIDEAVKNGHMDMIPLLRQYGGCLPAHLLSKEDAEYHQGMDLVHHASRGRLAKVLYLIEEGASVSFADYDKRSSLHLACAEGHVDVVSALLKAGADPMFKDRWGVTSLDEAKKNKHEKVIDLIENWVKSKEGNSEDEDWHECERVESICIEDVNSAQKVEAAVEEI